MSKQFPEALMTLSPELTELCRKLRARKGGWKSNISYSDDAGDLRNPDGPAAASAIETQADRYAEAREALEPFAKALEEWGDDPEQRDRRSLYDHPVAMGISLGDLRRAARALSKLGGEG